MSGTKRERTGLNQLLQAAEDGECGTVYLHSLSRLARESVITMPMLKRLVHKFGIRVICLSEGIDTATNGWEMQATIMAVMNEQYVKDLGANVLRGQEGTKLAGLSVGDYCFGYSSEPVPGTEARGSGRNGKPKMRYVIDPDHAELVRQIFDWFVNERRSITWIAQELNKRGAPKDHRSTTSAWRHGLVATLLRREKYVGVWRWGENRNVRDPESGDVRQERRDEDESSKWTMHHEELRIIDDATFTAAQARLDENAARTASSREDDGTWKAGGGRGSEPRHLLSGVIRCAECDAKFYVGGSNGKYLFCPNYKKGLCSCRTTLQRARAERLILQEVGRCIDQDSDWFDSLVRETLSQWTDLQKQVPLERQNAERQLAAIESKIQRLIDMVETGNAGSDIKNRLDQRRVERRKLQAVIAGFERQATPDTPPTREWIREQLLHLREILHGDAPAAAYALRRLLGGRITVYEVGQGKRKILRGEICIENSPALFNDDYGTDVVAGAGYRAVIEFADPPKIIEDSETAKRLADQGLMNREIGEQMNWHRSYVTKVLKYWYKTRGLSKPDGRSRRAPDR